LGELVAGSDEVVDRFAGFIAELEAFLEERE
jgi:hypothetical protein